MIVGMDFGTTNSGLAAYDGQRLQLLPIDPANANPRVARTALYLTNDQSLTIGRAAVDTYFTHNLGRPVRMERAWVGEISVAWADQFRWIRDVYVWVDALAPGRLFLSIKTGLRELDYVGTVVGRYFYPLEDLIALYLHAVKLKGERLLGRELHEIVLGRPVHFALDPEQDAMAEGRLVNAALRAGYERVYLEFEPVAAAFHYERTLERAQNVLVFDFGGGTLDFTVMRLGSPHGRQVLAVGGIPVAGDTFDQKLVRAKLPRHFGEGGVYGPRGREQPVPEWIYESFANWQTIITLQTPEHMAMLREIARTAREPRKLEALISMVSSHYGLKMFDTVELAKRMLSRRDEALIRLAGPRFDVSQPVTRGEFENILHDDVQNVDRALDEVLRTSGLAPEQIDAVIRTGGSSQIPVFQRLLDRKFGADKVRSIDIFSSVASGLGIIAHGIETGEVEARSFSREQVQAGEGLPATGLGARVPQVDLNLVLKRLAAEEEAPEQATASGGPGNPAAGGVGAGRPTPGSAGAARPTTGSAGAPANAPGRPGARGDAAPSPTVSLAIHTRDGRVIVADMARSALAAGHEIALPAGGGPTPGAGKAAEGADGAAEAAGAVAAAPDDTPRRVLAVDPGDHVLVVTSRFRFLLVSWRQLRSYGEQGVSLAAVEHLPPEEKFAALARWERLREFSRLLLISSKGFARWYRLEPLRAAIEGPNPFQLDHPVPGVPVDILGAGDGYELIAVDEAGHALRTPVSAISVQGSRVINVTGRERVRLGLAAGDGRDILLLTGDGYGKRIPSGLIPAAEKPNSRGKGWLARRVVADACTLPGTAAAGRAGFPPAPLAAPQPTPATGGVWVATSRRLAPLNLAQLAAAEDPSLRTQRLVKLAAGEEAGALLEL